MTYTITNNTASDILLPCNIIAPASSFVEISFVDFMYCMMDHTFLQQNEDSTITTTFDGNSVYLHKAPTTTEAAKLNAQLLKGIEVPTGTPDNGRGLVYNNTTGEYEYQHLATLDGTGKIPVSQLPDTIIGGLQYKGTWDCSTGSYPTSPEAGDYYICSTGGTISGTEYSTGDWLVYNGTSWDKIDNTDQVSSVNTKTGAVVLDADDIDDSTTTNKFATQTELDNISSNTAASHTRLHTITDASDHIAGERKVFYTDGTGNIQELSLGTDGQVLKSNGPSVAPSFDFIGEVVYPRFYFEGSWDAESYAYHGGLPTANSNGIESSGITPWVAPFDGKFIEMVIYMAKAMYSDYITPYPSECELRWNLIDFESTTYNSNSKTTYTVNLENTTGIQIKHYLEDVNKAWTINVEANNIYVDQGRPYAISFTKLFVGSGITDTRDLSVIFKIARI